MQLLLGEVKKYQGIKDEGVGLRHDCMVWKMRSKNISTQMSNEKCKVCQMLPVHHYLQLSGYPQLPRPCFSSFDCAVSRSGVASGAGFGAGAAS